jgi:hypothetical protein
VIQATVETLIHYFPHMCELRATRVAGMTMRSPAIGGLDDMPDARICDPHVLSPVLMCGVAVHRVIEGIEGGTFKVLVEERFPMA